MPNLAALRVSVARAMTSVGSIARTSVSTPLRYLPGTGAITLFSGSPEDALPLYVFRFPYGTGTQRLDRVTVDGGIWSLTKPFDPRTNAVDERWEAIQLYGPDAEGNPTVPVYLRANAVVTITRLGRPVIQATAIPARVGIATPEQFDGSGGLLPYRIYIVPGPTLQDNDLLTVVSYPNNPVLVGRVATIKDPVYDGSAVPLTSMSAAFRSQP